MGKKNIEIAGASDGTVAMLKKAYSLEMAAFHYWHYVDQYVEGIGVLHSDFFSESANDELEHAKKVAFRLDQLGAKATDNPQDWAEESGLGNLEPAKYYLKVVIDSNSNNEWDPGTYLEKSKPERTYHFTEMLDVRANWILREKMVLD